MDVYRFRSMKYLLNDEYQELKNRTIYFASPEQLNDPMEGLRDIVWRGDKIVWTNFFQTLRLLPECKLSSARNYDRSCRIRGRQVTN